MKLLKLKVVSALVLVSQVSQVVSAQKLSLSEQTHLLAKIDRSHDFEIKHMKLDGQNIFLFQGVQDFLNQFTEVDFKKSTSQKELLTIPESVELQSFNIVETRKDSACNKDLPNLTRSLKSTNQFDQLIVSPELIFRAKKFQKPTEEDFSTPESTYNVVMNYLSKIDLPESRPNSSLLKLRFSEVLRLIHIDQLLSLGQNALKARKALLAESEKNCLTLENSLKAKQIISETEKNIDELRKIFEIAKANRNRYSQLPFPMLSPEHRRTLSLYMGAFLWRFRGAGGYADINTQTRRKMFVEMGFTQIGKLNGADSSVADRVASLIRWGVQTTSWGKYYDMGRNNGEKHEDFIVMEELGRGITKMAKAYLSYEGYKSINLTYAGSQIGSCYYYAWEKMPALYMIAGDVPSPMAGLSGIPTGIGELCSGAGIGLALSEIYQQR